MNIKQAKNQIKNAITVYLTKDKFGNPVMPVEQQRPVFLMGPPGIGKTAIMEQIAAERGVGLVSYSMTHHTRQSALGLPFIVHKSYGDREYAITEYTMSEIIASVYDLMEETRVKEGILFLDEINCVSETLAPSMLQFLQYKIFGRHQVPKGWIVVAAGNPPEYNNSVREFDIVTWDRLKRVDIEPDFDIWKEYAYSRGIHPAVMTYLEIRKSDFYKVEATVDGRRFVTARSWSDLSDMILLYEQHGLTVEENLIGQYLQDKKIAREFALYYDLFNKYRSDYQVDKILEGKADESIKDRAHSAKFDERLSLLGLLLDAITEHLRSVCAAEEVQIELLNVLKELHKEVIKPKEAELSKLLAEKIKAMQMTLAAGRRASFMSRERQLVQENVIVILEEQQALVAKEGPKDRKAAFALVKKDFDRRMEEMRSSAAKAGKKLSNLFTFCQEVFAGGQEVLILVTELTINPYCAQFISRYGCKEYFACNRELLLYERHKEIITRLEEIDWELEED